MVVISLVSMVFGELMEHQKAGNAVVAKTFWVLQRLWLYCKRYVFTCLFQFMIFFGAIYRNLIILVKGKKA